MKNNIKKLLPAYILSFVISFMIYIYEPILTYSTNVNDFWFDFKTMLEAILIYFSILFLALSFFYTAIYLINKFILKKVKLYRYVMVLSYVAFMFIYIQGNYLIGSLPTLDGTTINWGSYTTENIISVCIVIVLLIIELIAMKKVKYNKISTANNFITIAIGLMLSVSLVSTLMTPEIFKEKTVVNSTIRNINSASSDKNFFIFVVDAVDSGEFASVVEESEEYKSTLEDFTYYPDTVSGYLYTRDSIPFILSGKWNENETDFTEYCKDAYENSEFLNELKDQNYKMNFYEYQMNMSSKAAENFDNIDVYESDVDRIKLFKHFTKYAMFKYLPYQLKPYSRVESVNFDSCKIDKNNELFVWDNDVAYNTIKNNELNVEENKYFQFLHIEGGHVPFNNDENVNIIPETEGTYRMKLKATLNIIDTFINRLKENNAYDNSVIVLMADHGYWASTGRQNPILYIKGINETHDEMVTSDIPVSYEDLVKVYLQLLDGEKTENLFKDIDSNRVRRFIENLFESEDTMTEYEVKGKAWDSSSIYATGREFKR